MNKGAELLKELFKGFPGVTIKERELRKTVGENGESVIVRHKVTVEHGMGILPWEFVFMPDGELMYYSQGSVEGAAGEN